MASSTLSPILNATPLGRRLDGTSGDDLLIGELGHDTLFGGMGNDTLRGDAGDDVYYVDSAGDVIVELASDNTSTQQTFSLGCFNDVVIASVSYTLADNVAVEDLMALGTLTESSLNPAGINLTGNNLGQGLIGNSTVNQLYGMGGDDILFGAGGSDSLFGGEGDDGLIGGLGNDSLSGDAGDDIFAFNLGTSTGNLMSGAQTTVSLTGGNDTADGGSGDDTIFMRGALQNYTITRLNATEYQISVKSGVSGISSSETMTFRNIEKLAFGELDNIDNDIRQNAVLLSSVVTSSIYDDVLSAASGANWSSNGLAGNDALTGRAGNDTLNGGAGADTLTGGAGDDVYYVDSADDVIVERFGDNTSTQQTFSLGCFNDVVIASVSYTLADNVAVEDLMAVGTLTESGSNPAGINLTGNNLGQGVIGNNAVNQLYGMGGADILFGAGGSDSLFGGEDDDILIGGLGNDSLSGDAGDDIFAFNLGTSTGNLMSGAQIGVVLTAGTDTADGGSGEDTIFMRGALQNYTITRISAADYQISVKAGVSGISSSEKMMLRNVEKLAFGDLDTFENDVQQNAVLLSSVVASSIYDDILSAASNANWSSNGLAGNDALTGRAGNDTLNGGAGADTLTGGAGDDVYYVDTAGDVIVELASDNTSAQQTFSLGCFNDVVIASASYTLADNVAVEDLMAVGTLTESNSNPAGINLTGNNLGQGVIGNNTANQLYGMGGADALFGAGGNDSLFGGEGDDALIGGLGNDNLSGDAGDDVFVFNAGTSTGNLMSGAQIGIAVTGGNDTADGGGGEDTIFMRGALQNYTITRISAADYQISVKAGTSGISSSETMTFRNIEKLAFGELDNFDNDIRENVVMLSSVVSASIYDDILSAASGANWSSNGLAGNDMLMGRAGNDTLNGGAGADTLDGGAGADVLTGGLGRDQFKFSSTLGDGNIDTVTDFTRGTDKILLDDAVFTQLSNVQSLVGRLVVGGSGAKAIDGNDYFIFNSVSRVLSYDPDGNGAMAMQAFATITGVTTLAATDFQII